MGIRQQAGDGGIGMDIKRVWVCSRCFQASCWHGKFMCDEAAYAGTVLMPIDELKKKGLEHQGNWSEKKILEIYGQVPEVFTEPGKGE